MLQREDNENHQDLSEWEKNRNRQYARKQYRKFFIETEFNEKEKTKMVNMRTIYVKTGKEGKDKKREYAPEQYKYLLKKKNTRIVNMYANDVEIFLKWSEITKLYLLWKYKKLDFLGGNYKKSFSFQKFGFSGKRERLCWELGK